MDLMKYGVTHRQLIDSFINGDDSLTCGLNDHQKPKYVKLFKRIFRLHRANKLKMLLRISKNMSLKTFYNVLLFLDYTNIDENIWSKMTKQYIDVLQDKIYFEWENVNTSTIIHKSMPKATMN